MPDEMPEVYYIWNLKTSAWSGLSNPYTSDFRDAKPFTKGGAIAYCKSRFGGEGVNPTALPVAASIMREIAKK